MAGGPPMPSPGRAVAVPTRDERRECFDASVSFVRAAQLPQSDRVAGEAAVVKAVADVVMSALNPRRQRNGQPLLVQDQIDVLARWVVDEMYGLGPIDELLRDGLVEEIAVTRFDLVFVYRSDGTVVRHPDQLWQSDSELREWLARLARSKSRTERAFNAQSPLLVVDLGGGLRLEGHRDCSMHTGFTLRRNTVRRASLAELSAAGMMPAVVAEFIAALMRCPNARVVFSGSTGSGKTTMVRASLAELGPKVRAVTIEDTAELSFFDEVDHPNVESWEARDANAEGVGAVSLGDLVRHALRARPDWLIVGECRDAEAAIPMLGAMTHGQSSLTTVHSPSARDALGKLALYLMQGGMDDVVAHTQLAMAVDFVVHLRRDLTTGRRQVSEIIEVTPVDGRRTGANVLWSCDRPSPTTMSHTRGQQLLQVGFNPQLLGGFANMSQTNGNGAAG